VFRTLIPDSTKAIVQGPDALEPRLTRAFLEYAQARGFQIDPARARHPRDKARTQRAVRDVRDDCFAGEHLQNVEMARAHARHWCEHDYGMRRHSTTQRRPREHFEAVERAPLLPAPTARYDLPLWCEPKVARDQHAQVARALYSLSRQFVGRRLVARADSATVRFFQGLVLVKTHPRVPPGHRSTDPHDFPAEKSATRDATRPSSSPRLPATARRSAATPARCSTSRCPGPACAASTPCSGWSSAAVPNGSRPCAPPRSRPACSRSIASSACSISPTPPLRPQARRGSSRSPVTCGRPGNTPSP